jgi:hypothetical protein
MHHDSSFHFGHRVLGHGLGWFLVAAALVNVSLGFCIPSFIYGLIFGRPASCELPSQPNNELTRNGIETTHRPAERASKFLVHESDG